jgi:hypothetical protein
MPAAILGRRRFTLADWHGHAELADPQTQDCATDNKLDNVVRGDPQHLSDDGQHGPEEYRLAVTDAVGEENTGEGADKGTELEGCDHSSFTRGIMSFRRSLGVDGIDLGEDLDPTV